MVFWLLTFLAQIKITANRAFPPNSYNVYLKAATAQNIFVHRQILLFHLMFSPFSFKMLPILIEQFLFQFYLQMLAFNCYFLLFLLRLLFLWLSVLNNFHFVHFFNQLVKWELFILRFVLILNFRLWELVNDHFLILIYIVTNISFSSL